MSIIQGNTKVSAGGYQIDQSIRFDRATSSALYRTQGTPDGTSWTLSFWMKRGQLRNGSGEEWFINGGAAYPDYIRFESNDTIRFRIFSRGIDNTTTAVFRDPGAWYHFVANWNGSTGAYNLWQNNVSLISGTGASGETYYNKSGQLFNIGRDGGGSNYFDGYFAEIVKLDNTVADPTSFGKYNDDGVWVPINVSGLTFGSEGFYIKGQDSSNLGDDSSGNTNDFTSSGLTADDQMLDTPTNNFCTLNTIEPVWGAKPTISNGNLDIAGASATVWNNAVATFKTLPSTGKWIWAAEPNTSGGGQCDPWIVNETGLASRNNYVYVDANGWETTFDSSSVHTVLNNGAGRNASFTYGSGDFHVICFDADSKKLWFGVYDVSAGTLQFHDGSTGFTGDPGAGTNPTYTLTGNEFSIGFATYTGRGGNVDFGQSDLLSQFTAPTDFKTLCTANLPDPTIADPGQYFNTVLFTGNSGTAFSVTGVGFQPDFVWGKPRSLADNHRLMDVVRGSTKQLLSNSTGAEFTQAQGITSFDSDGFTVGTHNGLNNGTNTYVAWNWLADNTSGSSNTDGSITSTVSANTTSGFSIVSYTGTGANATVGHGLGVAPQMIIIKNRPDVDNWIVYHEAMGATKGLNLNSTAAPTTAITYFNNTAPTSSVFSIGSGGGTNGSGDAQIAYCFANVEGFSKFGSYTGNGSTDGPFVFTGFRPKFIMYKRTSGGTGNWDILDAERDPINVADAVLAADKTTAETTYSTIKIDMLSNGYKIRGTQTNLNASGSTYIYMAFGDSFKTATAR